MLIICVGVFIVLLHAQYVFYTTHPFLFNIPGEGFGGLEVACWSLVPKFAGSNPAKAVRFLRAKKSSARLPSEGK